MNNEEFSSSQFFRSCFMLIFPIAFSIMVYVQAYYDKNTLILSLFSMLMLSFLYVITLYIVVTKYANSDEIKTGQYGKIVKKPIIAWIYVIKMAIRVILLLYILVKASAYLMLENYSEFWIALFAVVGGVMMGTRGRGGCVRFMQITFWSVILILLAMFASLLFKGDLSIPSLFKESFGLSFKDMFHNGIGDSVSHMLEGGYVLSLSLISFEMLLYIYLSVHKRTRGQLISGIGFSWIISLIASISVIYMLGVSYLRNGGKGILNIVGAVKMPFVSNGQSGILVCYMVVLFGLILIGTHMSFVGDAADYMGINRHRYLLLFGACVISVYMLLQKFFQDQDMLTFMAKYMAIVDIPLSLVLPAVARTRKLPLDKMAASLFGLVFVGVVLGFSLTGCQNKSLESVDYVTTIYIGSNGNLTLIYNELSGDKKSGIVEEKIYRSNYKTYREAKLEYERNRVNGLDASQLKYVIAENEEVLKSNYDILINELPNNYIEVLMLSDISTEWIIDKLRYEKNIEKQEKADMSITDFLSVHYRGENLTSLYR